MSPDHVPDLSRFGESGLFSLYRAILSELKHRGVIRTENAPVGDYAEYLVATALGGQLAPNSEKSWDVLAKDGEKLQVKARVVSDPAQPGQLQLSPFQSFSFDFAVIVLLSAADYTVSRAAKVPRYVVESSAIYRQHVNGKVLLCRSGNHGPSRLIGSNRNTPGSPNRPLLSGSSGRIEAGRVTPGQAGSTVWLSLALTVVVWLSCHWASHWPSSSRRARSH